eukprot:907899-Rhodomonas_salina.3
MSGTGIEYGDTMSGTDTEYGDTLLLLLLRCATSGTDRGDAAGEDVDWSLEGVNLMAKERI